MNKKNVFLEGALYALKSVVLVAIIFFLFITLLILLPAKIVEFTHWWSLILLPIYIGLIGGTIALVEEKLR